MHDTYDRWTEEVMLGIFIPGKGRFFHINLARTQAKVFMCYHAASEHWGRREVTPTARLGG